MTTAEILRKDRGMGKFKIENERCHVIGYTAGKDVPEDEDDQGKVCLIIRAVPKPQSSIFLDRFCEYTPEELYASFAAWEVPKGMDREPFETVRAEVLARIKQEIKP
jgi:hypothetical protein